MQSIDTLHRILATETEWAIAVSGGVDSMTLAFVACSNPQQTIQPIVLHALSPAVPPAATHLVQEYAMRFGWQLQLIDAGEYHDSRYRANPVNRCFYCKTNLYARIAATTTATIASGTNTDDLGDYRPGLLAAKDHDVRHPYVEARISKAMVRQIARHCALADIAELPAQPCLASRVETGIAIDADDLQFINKTEEMITRLTGPGNVRCRITRSGAHLQIDPALIDKPSMQAAVLHTFDQLCVDNQRSSDGIRPYIKGSAFIQRLPHEAD